MVLRPRPVAECTVSGVVPLGGRESLVLSDINLPESLGVAGTLTPPCATGEAGGASTSFLMVDSLFDPLPVSDYHPCTSTDDLQALLAPLPPIILGETYRSLLTHEHATSD